MHTYSKGCAMEKKELHISENSIADAVRCWGNAVSLALLDPSCSHFTIPLHDGVIGYKFSSLYAVVFGGPVCPEKSIEPLVTAFHSFCLQKNKKIIYLAGSKSFFKSYG